MPKNQQSKIFGLDYLGIQKKSDIFWNMSAAVLIEHSIKNNEGQLTDNGALVVKTGEYTGRSPGDKYIVDYGKPYDDEISWGSINKSISPSSFDKLYQKIIKFVSENPIYVEDVLVGADKSHQRRIRVVSEYAWSALFSKDLFISPSDNFDSDPDFTVLQAPSVLADPEADGIASKTFIVINFEKRVVIIGSTKYAGEIKKSVFSVMNRILPKENVLPMHCSANIGMEGDTALFFGLSGTGKTTLSSDPDRILIGDDEHGWDEKGVFNFEGGCYAKTINLSKELEPIIWQATQSFGCVLENVIYNEDSRQVDFTDSKLTENTRAAYPLRFVTKRKKDGCGNHPTNIFFLSADAFGVLPPISNLNEEQAAFYFLAGYTSKLAGTERGMGKEPEATFSACFGAPFLPLKPTVYAEMLKERIKLHNSRVWLVNTGWTGGSYGVGSRIKLQHTRTLIAAALKGVLDQAPSTLDPVFGLKIPSIVNGVPSELLNPINTWKNREEYLQVALNLKHKFEENSRLEC
jgi:phosphoenolpyruvate carboxykinase (ATP)